MNTNNKIGIIIVLVLLYLLIKDDGMKKFNIPEAKNTKKTNKTANYKKVAADVNNHGNTADNTAPAEMKSKYHTCENQEMRCNRISTPDMAMGIEKLPTDINDCINCCSRPYCGEDNYLYISPDFYMGRKSGRVNININRSVPRRNYAKETCYIKHF